MALGAVNLNSKDRQHVGRELEAYGTTMHELFKHMLAIKRWEHVKKNRRLEREEDAARAVSIKTVGGMKRFLQPDDWTKLQRFYLELDRVDMTSSDDVVIDDVLRRVTS